MFHIIKKSRIYSGRPYCGPSSNGRHLEFEFFTDAVMEADRMQTVNPVGWRVYSAITHLPIYETKENYEAPVHT